MYIYNEKYPAVVARKKSTRKKKEAVSVDAMRNRKVTLRRTYRKTILFNEKEKAAIDGYCKKYGIKSKSAFIRNAVISHILVDMDENYPSLF
jgi:hypothetical protein